MSVHSTEQTLPPDPSAPGLWWVLTAGTFRAWWWTPDEQRWSTGAGWVYPDDAWYDGWRCMYPATPPIPANAQPIDTAPQDGSTVMIYAPAVQDLNPIICECAWHPDAGWCVDELRRPMLWWPKADVPPEVQP